MSNHHPQPPNASDSTSQIRQESKGNRNQIIGQAVSSTIVNVTGGGQVTIYQSQLERSLQAEPQTSSAAIGANPYKGLLAFQESDGDRFFGREQQIEQLWQKFRSLHETETAIRVLPIYGPSGSGKSSLARAGLIPELARRPLSGCERARVAILVPGTHPLEALAAVLARVATDDPTPVAKTREFCGELAQANQMGEFDGLRRIADVLPDIAISPLIVLVDQFEEVYTFCTDQVERDRFIGNLLCAAAERSKRVSVIFTLRSDFLGETQKHPALNALFAEQGFLVRSMNEAELQQAIAKPAELAGHPLDQATIDLLIKDTEGREGALPLLQFALTRIWKGLAEGKPPVETLKAIGGVGGALAGEAQRIYDSLNVEEQAIARRLFLGLVQLGEGTKDTRRRALLDSLISHQDQSEQVKQVINQFAAPGVRLITLSANGSIETAEVSHEALFEHWKQLQRWLDSGRSDIRFQRRLDEAACYWDEQGRPDGLLWRSPDLDLLREFAQRLKHEMTNLQLKFFHDAQTVTKRQIRQRKFALLGFLGLMGAVTIISLLSYQSIRHEQKVTEAVFLGVNTKEVIEALPELERSANQLRKSIDTFPESIEPAAAIEHYHQHEEEFKKILAYYRNILRVIGKLDSEASQVQKQQAERVEQTLEVILNKYRIPQLNELQQEILDTHNQLRAEVNVPPLSWSEELAAYAQESADQLFQENGFKHRNSGSRVIGENIGAGSSVTLILKLWKEEKDYYDDSTNTCGQGRTCGSYTQMVWKSTTEIGCGIALHGTYETVVVCSYRPPGNYIGQQPY